MLPAGAPAQRLVRTHHITTPAHSSLITPNLHASTSGKLDGAGHACCVAYDAHTLEANRAAARADLVQRRHTSNVEADVGLIVGAIVGAIVFKDSAASTSAALLVEHESASHLHHWPLIVHADSLVAEPQRSMTVFLEHAAPTHSQIGAMLPCPHALCAVTPEQIASPIAAIGSKPLMLVTLERAAVSAAVIAASITAASNVLAKSVVPIVAA